MFGYVEPDKPELKIREFEVFRGYYCSLCKTIGKEYGQIPRLTLNYDLTFLYVLLDSLDTALITGRRERCIAHPLKKRFVVYSGKSVKYAAAMNILLTYYNLKDKWNDEKNVICGTGSLTLKRFYKKVKNEYPEKCKVIEDHLNELRKIEKRGCDVFDEAAEPFALIMRELFQSGHINDELTNKALGWMGYNLGRWIYILDAYDDIEEDIKNSNYNPIVNQYKYNGEEIQDFKKRILEPVDFSLTYSMSEVEKAYSLLNIEKNKGLLDNIIYSGLIVKTDKVIQGRGKENEEKSL
ncbi:MAG: hypothetical protein GX957_13035 [Clostridiaceae bacterium]|nr:hypothetical protein [Clostridiaceae bacterium]